MDITERRVNGALMLSISGDLTMRDGGTMVLADAVRSVLQRGYKHLVLEVGNLRYVDSSGLGELVQANAAAHNRGASLRLLHVSKRLRDLFTLTRLRPVFDCYDHETEALAGFGDREGDRS